MLEAVLLCVGFGHKMVVRFRLCFLLSQTTLHYLDKGFAGFSAITKPDPTW